MGFRVHMASLNRCLLSNYCRKKAWVMLFNTVQCVFKKEITISSRRFDGNRDGEGQLRATQTFLPEQRADRPDFGLHENTQSFPGGMAFGLGL